jgi:uncharacterized protein YifN (PemK superfamily)
MTTILINYFLENINIDTDTEAVLLGSEQLTGITEALLPNFTDDGHKISITKFFEGNEHYRWQVVNLDCSNHAAISVHLKPRVDAINEEFLSKTRQSNKSIISKLQLGTLVEVDFGFIPRVIKMSGILRSSKRYPDTIHHSEMHKRRLCIVVSAVWPTVQIIPVTSRAPKSGNNAIFQLSEASLSNLSDYNDKKKKSYALCNMIETVAASRVLPPQAYKKGPGWKHRNTSYTQRLTNEDTAKVKSALSHSVGMDDYDKIKRDYAIFFEKSRKLSLLNEEYTADIEQYSNIIQELTKYEGLYNSMKEVMIEWHMALGKNITTAEEEVNKQIEEISAVLEE